MTMNSAQATSTATTLVAIVMASSLPLIERLPEAHLLHHGGDAQEAGVELAALGAR